MVCWDSLKALEIIQDIYCCKANDLLFSHFPSLVYVRLSQFNCTTAFEYTITNCHHLKHLYYGTDLWCEPLTLPSSINCCLQQLCVESHATNLYAPLVQVLSAHGGLEKVKLLVKSTTTSAITTFINNSPSLILLCIETSPLYDDNDAVVFQEDYKDTVSKKFSNHKLLTIGDFILRSWGYYPSEIPASFDTNFNSFW